jgi:hypothetical protein
MMNPEAELIPENKEGSQTNTESTAEFAHEQEACKFFDVAKRRMLAVNHWQELAGAATAAFQLTDENGNDVDRSPEKNDPFKIDVPGPGSISGEGHDWVRVEDVVETEDTVAIMVRPATNPRNDREDIAHFFKEEATSSFMVKRQGNKVIAGVYGRNEQPNTETDKLVDKIRNTAMAAGAISGFSKLQWKQLVEGIVRKEQEVVSDE